MNNKKILIITPFFAPETHAAVFRAHKLTKYLKREGWNPIVLTVDTNYYYNEDPKLLAELEGIPIYRSRYIEPSLRGLRMWITGKDFTYKTLKKKGVYNNTNVVENDFQKEKSESLFRKVYKYLWNHFLDSPDRFWTWRRRAIRTAKELIKKENIQIVFTTCSPYTSDLIGIELKKKFNIRWVADFRDPLTYVQRNYSRVGRIYLNQRRIQDLTFKYADAITTTSSAYGLIFYDQYSGDYADKVFFIPTGLDDDYIPKADIEQDNYIIFVGEYLFEYGDAFLNMYSQAIHRVNNTKEHFKIKAIGNYDINSRTLNPIIHKFGLEDHVELIDYLPQTILYKYIKGAKYAIILAGEKAHWWNNNAKLVDYIALQKPVIAMVPDISEARSELTRAGLGIFLKNDDKSVQLLSSIIAGKEISLSIDKDYCKRYLASIQVKSFIKLFDNKAK